MASGKLLSNAACHQVLLCSFIGVTEERRDRIKPELEKAERLDVETEHTRRKPATGEG